jgi:hypothetical protein
VTDPLTQLCRCVGWPPGPARATTAPAEVYGAGPPADFQRLVDTIPPGVFQTFLRVLHPAEFESVDEYRATVGWYAEQVETGLLPWAVIGSDWIICWSAAAADPARWTVVVFDPVERKRYPYDGSATEFLQAFVLGGTGIEELAYIHEDHPTPEFVALEEQPPRAPAAVEPDFWSNDIGALSTLVPPIDASDLLREAVHTGPLASADNTDWAEIENRLGLRLPGDYKALFAGRAPIRIGPVQLTWPAADGLSDLQRRLYERVVDAYETRGGSRGPYHPEPGGLVAWAVADSGHTICWLPATEDPDAWPVTVVEPQFRSTATYGMSATRFLLRLVEEPELIAFL